LSIDKHIKEINIFKIKTSTISFV